MAGSAGNAKDAALGRPRGGDAALRGATGDAGRGAPGNPRQRRASSAHASRPRLPGAGVRTERGGEARGGARDETETRRRGDGGRGRPAARKRPDPDPRTPRPASAPASPRTTTPPRAPAPPQRASLSGGPVSFLWSRSRPCGQGELGRVRPQCPLMAPPGGQGGGAACRCPRGRVQGSTDSGPSGVCPRVSPSSLHPTPTPQSHPEPSTLDSAHLPGEPAAGQRGAERTPGQTLGCKV